jgi:hypothetical protein
MVRRRIEHVADPSRPFDMVATTFDTSRDAAFPLAPAECPARDSLKQRYSR